MIKILSSDQIRKWDQFTIEHEPIDSIDLMERASNAFVEEFLKIFTQKRPIRIFCGVGNNGGDGLAIGRILEANGWEVYTYVVGNPAKGSDDFKINLDKFDLYAVVDDKKDLPRLSDNDIIIDGLFGSGLSRPIGGIYLDVIDYLNNTQNKKVSIDIASGLFADQPVEKGHMIFKPDITISFQSPKLAFFLPKSHPYIGEWNIVKIGLKEEFLKKESTNYVLSEKSDLISYIPKRGKFTHKSEVGKLLIVSGSKGKMGATVLCARASFAAGASLVNVCTPTCGTGILQISIPEAMVMEDPNEKWITKIPNTSDTIAIGPGLGTEDETISAFENLLKNINHPLVIDADAINILAKKKALLMHVPKNSILTPHPGEFKRLVGSWKDDFEKLDKLQKLCLKYEINVVLKGAYSASCNAQGKIHFNPTGNPALATAGSGDVLTGIISAFLAQRVAPFNALRLGVFVHGLAGDLVIGETKHYALTASKIIDFVPAAIQRITESSAH